MNEKQKSMLAGGGLLLAAFIWGFAFVVVKNALDVVPPIYMLAFRFTLAALALGVIFRKRLNNLNRTLLRQGVVLGVFLFLAYAFQTVGCQYTTAGKNAFLTTVYVVIVPFLHWMLRGKRPDKYTVAAAWMALVGIGLLSLNSDLSINLGDVLTLICGFCYSFHMICIDKYTETGDPVLLTVLQLAVVALLSWGIAPFYDGAFPMGVFSRDAIVAMLYLGFLSTMVGFMLQNIGQKFTAPATAALLLSFESVFGALFSALFLKERMSGRMIVGCALLFVSIILSETKLSFLRKRGKKEDDQTVRSIL